MVVKKAITAFLAVGLTFVAACAVSEEQMIEHAEESFEEKMKADPKEPTYENDSIKIYKPGHLQVEEEDSYNIVLNDNDQMYLLFVGDNETYETKEELLEAQRMTEDPRYVDMVTDDDVNGYLIIEEMDDDSYKVIAGFNSVKGSTISSLSDVVNDAELLFEMVQSVQLK
ncbi:hypothetical protein [Alteribacter populi]|uniref:hypothetical protein n=1 Tax=Alteribacter populi TaxID=2011011 RepID=UPI000BBA501F|nr:hypothetical protein [Alteribacter populi]